jgi:hypothetical protein
VLGGRGSVQGSSLGYRRLARVALDLHARIWCLPLLALARQGACMLTKAFHALLLLLPFMSCSLAQAFRCCWCPW